MEIGVNKVRFCLTKTYVLFIHPTLSGLNFTNMNKKVFNCNGKTILTIAVTSLLVGCNSELEDAFLTETSPQLFGVCQVSTGNVVQHKDSIAFTDLDIAWFNPKTREIKFKEYDKIKSVPIYASISVKSSSETLFIIAANINPVVNRAYDDLVLFCDKDGKYYLNDNYPNYWNLEKTKQNADKRSEGWNKFINLLRKEGRIK